ncbi:MAG: hypothetical protein ACFFCI_10120 [Promethearchaeota archaeon]
MEDRANFFLKFLTALRSEILDYYNKTHSYLKDLTSYKNIDLRKELSSDSEEVQEDTLTKMFKAVKTGLNTIGVSINRVSEIQTIFQKEVRNNKTEFLTYESYLEEYLKKHINKVLFEIIIEYLNDLDAKKVETLKLFKLLPKNFIETLLDFKKKNIKSAEAKEFLMSPGIENYLEFADLSIKIESVQRKPKKEAKTKLEKEKKAIKIEKKESAESDILTQLEEAKQEAIQTLKTPKKELLKPSIDMLQKEIDQKVPLETQESNIETPLISTNENLKASLPPTPTLKREERLESFLGNFGNLPIVHPDLVNNFKINTGNLVNSKVVNLDFFDLENLFYFISILKMLNIESPFTPNEIIDIMKNFVNEQIFSVSKNNVPDLINNFYGLAILLEMNMLNKVNIVDLNNIDKYLQSELKFFIPEKLKFNFHLLFCLIFLKRTELITPNKLHYSNSLLNLNISNLKDFNPRLDIFYHLSLLKLIDNKSNLENFKDPYIDELKKVLTVNGSISDLISDSARTLLVLDLLNLKDQESKLCGRLLNYIITSTEYFSLDNPNRDFNWRIDKLAFRVELKMLFWALLACTRYKPEHLIKR